MSIFKYLAFFYKWSHSHGLSITKIHIAYLILAIRTSLSLRIVSLRKYSSACVSAGWEDDIQGPILARIQLLIVFANGKRSDIIICPWALFIFKDTKNSQQRSPSQSGDPDIFGGCMLSLSLSLNINNISGSNQWPSDSF